MVKIDFAKTGKSYPNLLDQCAKFLDYCANLPCDMCTQSGPCTESIHTETNYTMTQYNYFIDENLAHSFYFSIKLY